ncbi:MAG: hypothetical protein QG576_898 [Bacteroidota bacterium]|nr:hypothetical protein [Bacteroidota bacterium]
MKEEDKNRKKDLSDFIKYHKRDMTNLQRNTFEKKLQKDPFAEEAEEGLSGFSPDEVKSDLDLLEKKLKKRTSNNRRVIIYRIAASIAVLMVISSVYFLAERNRSKEKTAEIALNQTPLEIRRSEPITLPEVSPSSENMQIPRASAEKKSKETENIPSAQKSKKDIYSAPDSVRLESIDLLAASEVELQEETALAQGALNEVVVTGYGVSKRSKAVAAAVAEEDKAGNELTGYTPPSPADGKESFDKYVKENIRKPASLPDGERAIVVISFTITSSGIIENIKVIRSQGREYSEEAIRLIKEGPPWKPAEQNGEKIDDEVRLRIVFG